MDVFALAISFAPDQSLIGFVAWEAKKVGCNVDFLLILYENILSICYWKIESLMNNERKLVVCNMANINLKS